MERSARKHARRWFRSNAHHVSGRRSAELVALALVGVSCAAEEPLPTAPLAVQSESIVHGEASGPSENQVVMLQTAGQFLCSGTLVAPNLVVTARHCVSRTDPGMVCTPDGRTLAGGRVLADFPAESVVIYVGNRRSNLLARARGAELVHDGATRLCNHDLAFVVLDRPLADVAVAKVRLNEITHAAEQITAVGWGLTQRGVLPSARQQRQHVPVLDVGPSLLVAPNELMVGESICSGDSGGPALSDTGAVIGVVSRGGNGRTSPLRPALGCLGPDVRNIYSRLAAFKQLVSLAFDAAGARPLLE